MADRDVEGLLRWSLAWMALASAVIHASAAAEHRGLPLHVAFFLVVAALQGGLAAAVLRGRSRRWVAVSAAFSGALVVIWVLSRTVGLPVEGAATAEPIGFKDGISTLLELGVVAGAGLLGALPEAGRRIALSTGPLASIVIAASVGGLSVSGLLARHTHDDRVHLHGGEVQAVAEHHGPADPAAQHHRGRDHTATPAPGADDSGAGGHSHPTDVIHLSEAHDHDHIHRAFAAGVGPAAGHRHATAAEAVIDDGPAPHHGRAHRRHEADDALPGEDTGGDGHRHQPEHHAGAGPGHDPGDDTNPTAERLIDDVFRLLEPHGQPKFRSNHTESEVPT
jgi:hypothetical protein